MTNRYPLTLKLGFQVKAVLDWELSTIGDATADLAYNCLPYYLPPDFQVCTTLDRLCIHPHLSTSLTLFLYLSQIPGFAGRPLPEGVPTEEAYVKLYCQRAGEPQRLNQAFALCTKPLLYVQRAGRNRSPLRPLILLDSEPETLAEGATSAHRPKAKTSDVIHRHVSHDLTMH